MRELEFRRRGDLLGLKFYLSLNFVVQTLSLRFDMTIYYLLE